MDPSVIAKSGTEHSHQAAFFAAMVEHRSQYPELRWMYAIPNGGERNIAVAARLKAGGVKAGVPDVFLPCPRKGFHGLYVEFKRPKGNAKAAGKLSKDQEDFREFLLNEGYAYAVVYDYLTAKNVVLDYLAS